MSFYGKDLFKFDPTDLNHDVLGSYVIGAGGTVITSTTDGADEGLDVYLLNDTLAVTQSGSWTVGVNDITIGGNTLAIDASGYLTVNVNGTVSVSATDFDIRDLTHVSDSIKIGDGTDFLAVNTDGSINVEIDGNVSDDAADSGDPVKVGSRSVDGLLSAISASDDRADLLSDMYRRVWVNDSPNVGITLSKPTISTTAAEIASTPQPGRTRILVQNLSNQAIYLGEDNTVTISTGIRVNKNMTLELPWGEDLDLWAISDTGITSDVRVLEMA